jgi:hypothetical protein
MMNSRTTPLWYVMALFLLTLFIIPILPHPVASAELDPEFTLYRSYIGGSGHDTITGVVADEFGNVVLAGFSEADDASSVNPNFGPQGAFDGFVAKIDSSGQLVFHKIFGGSSSDMPYDLCLGTDGSIVVVGGTDSDNLPVTDDAMRSTNNAGDWDGFVVRFSTVGEIIYCSYLGGIDDDKAYGVVSDSQSGYTILGTTRSHNYPTVNAIQEHYEGEQDLFLTRFTSDFQNRTFSTFWGSNETEEILEQGRPMICSSNDELYLTASTESFSFPYERLRQNVTLDVFVSRIELTGNPLNTIFLNASYDLRDKEYGASIAFDDNGSVYTTGIVYHREQRQTEGGGDFYFVFDGAMYIAKIDATLQERSAYTTLDGWYNETVCDIAVNASGFVHVCGHTESINYPTIETIEEYSGGYDAFLTVFDPDNYSIIVHSSFTGGVDDESGTYITFDAYDRIVLCGSTNSIDLLPVNAFQDFKADGGYGFDGYVWCFDLSLRAVPVEIEPIIIDPNLVLVGVAIVPPFFAGVFLVVVYHRMKKKGLDAVSLNPE